MSNIENPVGHNEEIGNKGLDLKQEVDVDIKQMPLIGKEFEKKKNGLRRKIAAFALTGAILLGGTGCNFNNVNASEDPTPLYISNNENTDDDTITLEIKKPDLSKYDSELTESKPELKEFCSKLLYAYDESNTFVLGGNYNPEDTKFQNFIDRDTILEYAKTGEGIDTINFEDGTPAFCMINMSETYKERMKEAVNQWLEVCPDFLDSITDNGMCIYFDNKYDPEYGHNASYNNYGVLICNMDDSDLDTLDVSGDGSMEDNSLVMMMRRYLAIEPFGMKTNNLGGDFLDSAYEPVIKQALYLACVRYLSITAEDEFCISMIDGAQEGLEYYLNMCEDQDRAMKLVQEVEDKNLVMPFGADNWQEIEEVISDVVEDSSGIINQ